MLKLIFRNFLLLIILSVVLGTTPVVAQTTHPVNLDGMSFLPPDITIALGDTVHWVWVSGGSHNVESGTIVGGAGVHDGKFRSGDPEIGATFDLLFDQAFLDTNPMTDNVYPYYCIVHAIADMKGTVSVVDCISDDDCDDNTYCNGVETCVENSCQTGTSIDCDDGINCTIDSCNEDTDSCDHTADDAACEDSLHCNGADTCNTSTGCVHAGTPCEAGEVCNEDTDACVTCVVDEDCDDSIDCTIDTCNTDGSCDHAADDAACEDNLFCNGADICNTSTGCVHAGTPCEAGKVCDEDTDACVTCDVDEDCDDSIDCTIDTCNTDGSCDHAADDAACEDNLHCNGADTCNTSTGCVHAGTPCEADKVCDEVTDDCVTCVVDEDCDDAVDCTIDGCNNNACSHLVIHGLCEDNVFCNGIEICRLTEGCVSLGNPCTTGTCDEDSDSCASCLTDSDCDDRDPCTDDLCISGECEFESIEDCGDDSTDDSDGDDNSDTVVGQVSPPICGIFGMIPMLFMVFGLAGAKIIRRRKRTY